MDALKWILTASITLALMFLGLKADSDKDKRESNAPVVSVFQIF